MSLDIFKRKFGKDPKEFNSVKEINSFVEERIGHKLEVIDIYPDICSSRGSILPVNDMNVDEIFENALNKQTS